MALIYWISTYSLTNQLSQTQISGLNKSGFAVAWLEQHPAATRPFVE